MSKRPSTVSVPPLSIGIPPDTTVVCVCVDFTRCACSVRNISRAPLHGRVPWGSLMFGRVPKNGAPFLGTRPNISEPHGTRPCSGALEILRTEHAQRVKSTHTQTTVVSGGIPIERGGTLTVLGRFDIRAYPPLGPEMGGIFCAGGWQWILWCWRQYTRPSGTCAVPRHHHADVSPLFLLPWLTGCS